jgi:hypothetical protein
MLSFVRTVPLPAPDGWTHTLYACRPKRALTVTSPDTVTVFWGYRRDVPRYMPADTDPLSGLVARVTVVPLATVPEQLLPQSIPGPVTVPVPQPPLRMVSVSYSRVKVAVTFLLPLMVTVQPFPAVLSHPSQPVKDELVLGVAVRVTTVPPARLKEQVLPQSIPPPVTVPLPVPSRWTDSE